MEVKYAGHWFKKEVDIKSQGILYLINFAMPKPVRLKAFDHGRSLLLIHIYNGRNIDKMVDHTTGINIRILSRQLLS